MLAVPSRVLSSAGGDAGNRVLVKWGWFFRSFWRKRSSKSTVRGLKLFI